MYFHSVWDSIDKELNTMNNLVARLLLGEQRMLKPSNEESKVTLTSKTIGFKFKMCPCIHVSSLIR